MESASDSDSAVPHEQDRPKRQAPGTYFTVQDEDSMDLLGSSQDEVQDLPPERLEISSSPEDTMARKDRAPFVSK